MFKKFSTYICCKIPKMGCFVGSGVPVLYIGRTVPKVNLLNLLCKYRFLLWEPCEIRDYNAEK
jgi:hypothetical protein